MTATLKDGTEVQVIYTGQHAGSNSDGEDFGHDVQIESVIDIDSEMELIHRLPSEEIHQLYERAVDDYFEHL